MEIITFLGLKKLEEMKKNGEPFPDNWKELVLDYLARKEKTLKKWKRKFGTTSELFEESYQTYMHACIIAKRLGITWRMKKREEI